MRPLRTADARGATRPKLTATEPSVATTMSATGASSGCAEGELRIDEQRAHPHEQDERDRDPIELQAERQLDRQRVPSDRDEQHDREDEPEQDVPRENRPVPRDEGRQRRSASPRRARRHGRRPRPREHQRAAHDETEPEVGPPTGLVACRALRLTHPPCASVPSSVVWCGATDSGVPECVRDRATDEVDARRRRGGFVTAAVAPSGPRRRAGSDAAALGSAGSWSIGAGRSSAAGTGRPCRLEQRCPA